MKRKHVSSRAMLLLAGGLLLGFSWKAAAAGTAAGTNISITATLQYAVNGEDQVDLTASAAFVVDRKIDLTVATTDAAAVKTQPGQTLALTFTVTNDGNSTIDANLASTAVATAAAAKFAGNDAFDMNAVAAYVESGATGGYQSDQDTATVIDDLAADSTVTVYIVATAPGTGQTNGDISSYHLLVTALEPSGGALAETSGSDTLDQVDTVFADGQGTDTANDVSGDAKHSSQSDFEYYSGVLSITKGSATIRDPFNGDSNPKAIPGAYVQYSITVSNAAGAASATLSQIQDVLNANLKIDPDLVDGAGTPESAATYSVKVVTTGTSRPSAGTVYYTADAADTDADGAGHTDPGAVAGTLTVNMGTVLAAETGYAAGELKADESVTVSYNVIVQ